MLLVVNGVDLTPHIDEKSYSVNATAEYEKWLDGNYREHRIYTRDKVQGSFVVTLYGANGMDTAAFLSNWNAAVSNHVITLNCFVQNHNASETIEAYFTFDGTFHREMINGDYCDKLKVTITEK